MNLNCQSKRSSFDNTSESSNSSKVLNGVVLVIFLLPESKILLKKLDDGLGITEVILFEFIDLVESLLKGLVSDLASLLVVLHNLILEDREVKGKTKSDGVARLKLDVVGLVVSLKSVLLDLLKVITLGVLGNVAVVVTNHLDEESLGFTIASLGENLGVDDVNDTLAVGLETSLDGLLVGSEGIRELGVLGILLDGSNGAASGSLGRDKVLEGNREEVSLVGGNFSTLLLEDIGEEFNHIFESFGLLGNSGKEYLLFN